MNEPAYHPPGTRYLRTDVRYMRRSELFRSAREFLAAGLLGLTATLAVGRVFLRDPGAPNVFVASVLFGLVVVSGMGFAGALYLLLRGCFRDEAYDPQIVWLADQAKRATPEDGQEPASEATADRVEMLASDAESPHEFVARLLLSVARRQLTAEDAMRELRSREAELASKKDRLLNQAWHLMLHYIADADIRAKEPSYGVAKRREMERLAESIRGDG